MILGNEGSGGRISVPDPFALQADKPLSEVSGSGLLPPLTIEDTCTLGQNECTCVWEEQQPAQRSQLLKVYCQL